MGKIKDIGPVALNEEPSEGLYRLFQDSSGKVKELWVKQRRTKRDADGYLDAVGGYRKIEDYNKKPRIDDKTLIGGLFESSENELIRIFAYQFEVCNIKDAISFNDAFERARMLAYHVVIKFHETLTDKSFPATYFHQDIVMMFDQRVTAASLGMFDPGYAQKRVRGTSEVMLRTLYGARKLWVSNPSVLANSLMLAEMHKHIAIARSKDPFDKHNLYNQSSAAFTLLTFSYLLGKAISEGYRAEKVKWEGSLSETDWFFYWKALGSTMGIRTDLLPDTQMQAEELWRDFLYDDGTKIVAPGRLDLLVNTDTGIRDKENITFGYGSYPPESVDTLFGSNLDEVIALLHIGLQKHEDGDVDMLTQEAKEKYMNALKKIDSDKKRDFKPEAINLLNRQSTAIALTMLRHSSGAIRLKPVGEKNADLRKLIYLVNVTHLLEIYRDACSNLDDVVPKGMTASLFFYDTWTLKLRLR